MGSCMLLFPVYSPLLPSPCLFHRHRLCLMSQSSQVTNIININNNTNTNTNINTYTYTDTINNPIWGRSVFFRDRALAPRGASTPLLRVESCSLPSWWPQHNPSYPALCRQDTTSPWSTDYWRKQLNSDTNASNKTYLKEIQEKKE